MADARPPNGGVEKRGGVPKRGGVEKRGGVPPMAGGKLNTAKGFCGAGAAGVGPPWTGVLVPVDCCGKALPVTGEPSRTVAWRWLWWNDEAAGEAERGRGEGMGRSDECEETEEGPPMVTGRLLAR